ncbi:MAG: winged helix-turn-helix domain-containing protein [Rhodospirillaceae bacterium]|nr:winged helix-turn-helix domain-containing protein [Rhodospirillaceae bacterium]
MIVDARSRFSVADAPHSQGVVGRGRRSDCRTARVAAEGLTPEDLMERTRGGHTTKFKDRVSWSITHFLYAGLVERVRRAVYRIAPEGKQLLSRNLTRIDLELLLQFPAYVE